MSSYATLVHASVVLQLVTNFLSFTLEYEPVSVLLDQIFETGSLAFQTTASRFALATIASELSSFAS